MRGEEQEIPDQGENFKARRGNPLMTYRHWDLRNPVVTPKKGENVTPSLSLSLAPDPEDLKKRCLRMSVGCALLNSKQRQEKKGNERC